MNRLKTTPIPVNRTQRAQEHRILTSLPAGKMVPLAAIPLLREDAVTRAQFMLSFEMQETVEVLMNAVNVRVMAYLVPKLAFERFSGMDAINRSYSGVPNEADEVVPWFDPMVAPAHGANDVFTYMGKHFKPGDEINSEYLEAYNAIWNFRAKNRSPDITLRDRLDGDLAPAFWNHQTFAHIVPDYDQAVIDGEVALNVVNSKMPVKGIMQFGTAGVAASYTGRESGETGNTTHPKAWQITDGAVGGGQTSIVIKAAGDGVSNHPDIWAELQANGITVSLSNIDMARKTQAFALLRRQYSGHSDDYIIDLLMQGISIPEQVWKQPILLGDMATMFGMSKRYASDSGNLTESVVNGVTMLPMNFTVPRCPTGGVVMLVAEITPEQLFERQQDPYLYARTVDVLPNFLRDDLDPEKVQIVQNREIDIDHDTPTDTFGYAPLNHQWARSIPQIGGKFYRPTVDAAFDEDRQRIWAVETQNPTLSTDFYLCTTMHLKPFVFQNQDPFECLVRGTTVIRGNTRFGDLLVEANNDYAEIVEEQPNDRIVKS